MDDLDPLAGLGEQNLTVGSSSSEVYTVSHLKKDLHGWRHVILPISRILTWEQPWHPALIFAINSIKFLIVWYMDPSVLTALALVCLILCIADYAVPLLSDTMVSPEAWSGEQEKQFEVICEKIIKVKGNVECAINQGKNMKQEKPKMFVIITSVALLLMAYIGYCFNNLLLTYFIVTFALMLPGLRHHGIIQKYFGQISTKASELMNKAGAKMKKT